MATPTVSQLSIRRATPAQRALALPEILSNIFSQNDLDTTNAKLTASDLLNFAIVNTTWYNEAIRVLWGHPEKPIDQIMASIPPNRRQYYADCVRSMYMLSRVGDMDHFAIGGSLHGLSFPRLDKLSVNIYTNKLYVIPLAHPTDWTKDMYFKKREPKRDHEANLDGVLGVIEKYIPSPDELYLRYEGPNSHLSGVVPVPKENRVVPAPTAHWYIDRRPVKKADDDDDEHEDLLL